MATPHVAGVIALMLEANPELTPLEVKKIIQETATNMPGYEASEIGPNGSNLPLEPHELLITRIGELKSQI